MKDLSPETQKLVDLVKQAKAAEDDVLRSIQQRPDDYILDNLDYARAHRARMATEGARWRAMVALAKEAGVP